MYIMGIVFINVSWPKLFFMIYLDKLQMLPTSKYKCFDILIGKIRFCELSQNLQNSHHM